MACSSLACPASRVGKQRAYHCFFPWAQTAQFLLSRKYLPTGPVPPGSFYHPGRARVENTDLSGVGGTGKLKALLIKGWTKWLWGFVSSNLTHFGVFIKIFVPRLSSLSKLKPDKTSNASLLQKKVHADQAPSKALVKKKQGLQSLLKFSSEGAHCFSKLIPCSANCSRKSPGFGQCQAGQPMWRN